MIQFYFLICLLWLICFILDIEIWLRMCVGWNQMFVLSCSRTLTTYFIFVNTCCTSVCTDAQVCNNLKSCLQLMFSVVCTPVCPYTLMCNNHCSFILFHQSGIFQGLVIFPLIHLWSYSCLHYWMLLFLWLHLCSKLRTN